MLLLRLLVAPSLVVVATHDAANYLATSLQPTSTTDRFLFGLVMREAICGVILELLGLNMLAVHAADVGVLSFVAVGEHHIFSDLLLWNFGVGSHPGAFAVNARPDMLFPSL